MTIVIYIAFWSKFHLFILPGIKQWGDNVIFATLVDLTVDIRVSPWVVSCNTSDHWRFRDCTSVRLWLFIFSWVVWLIAAVKQHLSKSFFACAIILFLKMVFMSGRACLISDTFKLLQVSVQGESLAYLYDFIIFNPIFSTCELHVIIRGHSLAISTRVKYNETIVFFGCWQCSIFS